MLAMPMLALGMYLQDWRILGLTFVWLVVNPWFFPPPKRINNWMSKGVLGEQLYFQEKKFFRADLPTLLNMANIPLFALFIYFAWQQALVEMLLAGVLVMVVKFWFIDRMVALYEAESARS